MKWHGTHLSPKETYDANADDRTAKPIHMVTQTGFMALIAGGGWLLHQSAIAHVDRSLDIMTERFEARFETLETKIDANGVLIRQNGERIERNGEQIAQLRERMAAVEVRVSALEVRVGELEVRISSLKDAIRFFHPPEGVSQQEP